MTSTLRTAVVGASGYAGGELLRLVSGHPHLHLGEAMAHSNAGEEIVAIHPRLTTLPGRTFAAINPSSLAEHDLVFLALPHGQSASLVSALPSELPVIDLGADFRLGSATDWERYYGGAHAGTWTYGLTEANRDAIAASRRVANPGCYATAIALGALPIAAAADGDLVVVAASGTTGAGRSAKVELLASEVMGSLKPYKVGGIHQHTPEIEQTLAAFASSTARIIFTPILAPMPRGIIATITARSSMSEASAREAFTEYYSSSPFVHLLPARTQPSTGATLGSNAVLIQVARDDRTDHLVVTVALDNLVKGAAGQAIQNANIIFDFAEDAGLDHMGVAP